MNDREINEISVAVVLFFFYILISIKEKDNVFATLSLSVSASLVASVITDYNNRKTNEEKETTIFEKTVMPFCVCVENYIEYLVEVSKHTNIVCVLNNSYPKLNTGTMKEQFKNASEIKRGGDICRIGAMITELNREQATMIAVNESWSDFFSDLKEMIGLDTLLTRMWGDENFNEQTKVDQLNAYYEKIIGKHREAYQLMGKANPITKEG